MSSQQPMGGAFCSHHEPTACLRCRPLNVAPSGHPPSAQSRSLFNAADLARLKETFALWGLPKILTVLGRDSTLIWGTFLFFFSMATAFLTAGGQAFLLFKWRFFKKEDDLIPVALSGWG